SGQEAYSLAMMIDQTCEELGRRPLIQVFATDIDEEMLVRARSGEYLTSEYEDLPKLYQDKYTVSRDGNFEIINKIREMVRFSFHNLIQDPPFSKIDFISCRNLLIYLGEGLQSELFPVFHFSLNPGGYLFLGTSESISRQNDLFAAVDQSSRIFRRLDTGKRVNLNLPLGRTTPHKRPQSQRLSEERDFPQFSSMQSSHDEVYQEYAPPFVRVAPDGRIIGSSGDLGLFLLARPGEERDLFSLLRPGIREFAVSLLTDAVKAGKRLAVEDVEVHTSFGHVSTDIIAHPMRDNTVSLIFVVQEPLKPTVKKYAVEPISVDKRVSDLQEQLSLTQLQLKGKVEEIETANEELKSSNEEMMSMNEELQSANEELTTANEELKNKIDELTLANADLDNFLSSADLAMVVVDRSLRIRHVTGAATDILPIRHTDRGRFLTEFNLTFGLDSVSQKILLVMETSTPFAQTTTPDAEGRSFFLRITPFFYKDGAIEGAMITLTDISKEIALRHDLTLESERAMLAMRAGRMGMAELDVESGAVTIDAVLAKQFELKKSGVLSMEELVTNIVPEDIPVMNENLAKAIEKEEEYEFDFRIKLPDGGIRWMRTLGASYKSREGRNKVIGPTIDITDVTNYRERELIVSEMSHRIKNLFAVISSLVSTARGYDDPKEMSSDLVGKISSLGRVYDLARKKVTLDGVDLAKLLRSVIDPHASTQAIEILGPDMLVNNDMLNTFTLIVHELTTNAFKYGALSHEDGVLQISWATDETGVTVLNWSETVPSFEKPVEKSGFGSKLLEGAAEQLGGSIQRNFTNSGVEVQLTAKLVEKSSNDP
ncbi:MAG: CheR family methyltransferase, partial [Pseudomonadota bacterium]